MSGRAIVCPLRGVENKRYFLKIPAALRAESNECALSTHANTAEAQAVLTGSIEQLLHTAEINDFPKETFPVSIFTLGIR